MKAVWEQETPEPLAVSRDHSMGSRAHTSCSRRFYYFTSTAIPCTWVQARLKRMKYCQ
jgi:hypothetical protein